MISNTTIKEQKFRSFIYFGNDIVWKSRKFVRPPNGFLPKDVAEERKEAYLALNPKILPRFVTEQVK